MSASLTPGQRSPITTEDDYLAFDNASPTKHEFIGGELVAMVGAKRRHNLIALNVGASLHTQLRRRACEVYSNDMRVKASPSGDYSYPDVVVVCTTPQFLEDNERTLLNPILIVEVLSASTAAYDRGPKAQAYRTLPSLQAYLLIAQHAPHIEYHQRTAEGWLLQDIVGGGASVELVAIGCTLSLADVYEKVSFDAETPPPPGE